MTKLTRRLLYVSIPIAGFLISVWLSRPWTAISMPAARRECPLTDSIVAGPPYFPASHATIPAAGAITHVPEFHDCQRFILRNSVPQIVRVNRWPLVWLTWRTYDSLFAVFADEHLEGRWLPGASKVQVIVNPVNGTVSTITTYTPPADSGKYVLFAEIVSWAGKYDSLGIGPGFNCLFMKGPANATARLVHYGPEEPNCAAEYSPDTSTTRPGKELTVRQATVAGLGPADYPLVARWDWDPVRREHYIGIRCGAAWCEVGAKGVNVSASLTLDGQAATKLRRVSEVKGWYDEQRLAHGTNQLSASVVRGVAIPDSALDAYTEANFDKVWAPAARIMISTADDAYSQKLNLVPPIAGAALNTSAAHNLLSVCRGTRADCQGVPAELICPGAGGQPAGPTEVLWWARIDRASPIKVTTVAEGDLAYRCIKRFAHPELGQRHIPGTVRWRWQANDETVWMRCAQGCCEVH